MPKPHKLNNTFSLHSARKSEKITKRTVHAFLTISILIFLLWPLFISISIINRSTTIQNERRYRDDHLSHILSVNEHSSDKNEFRILHVVTSLHEYEDGERGTVKGSDRLFNILVPTLKTTVTSMLEEKSWSVDVYLILGYKGLTSERRKKIVDALPEGVGLEFWEDATPIGDGDEENKGYAVEKTYALSRQHRFVVKDKLNSYDFFSCWEDDMRITSDHIKTFLGISAEIDRLKVEAISRKYNSTPSYDSLLTLKQLDRMIPGFIRVEVLTNGQQFHEDMGPIKANASVQVDPNPCCIPFQNRDGELSNNRTFPTSKDIVLWETSIKALRVRKIPNSFLDWVCLLPGAILPNQVNTEAEADIASYWSSGKGEFGNFGDLVAYMQTPLNFAQQAGWMMTRDQVIHFDKYCIIGFLPPFMEPRWVQNGLKSGYHSVEYWSGGFQLFGEECNAQRIISTDPDIFSRQLLFHVSNNKQHMRRDRLVPADTLLGQLRTVSTRAAAYAAFLETF